MKWNRIWFVFPLLFLSQQGRAKAQQMVIPAGTLLRCTLNEANFSSATAEVGDPVVCHPEVIQEFGRQVFPRGSYVTGHLEAYKNPGHFFGKGWMQLQFDRIGLPNADLPVPGKIVAVRGYRVDRQGKIRGHGHATRDAVEWMLPPLWPWKVSMLPARGPRPTLKGEVPVTLRLMEDVAVPPMASAVLPPSRQPASSPAPSSPPAKKFSVQYLPPSAPGLANSASASDPVPAQTKLTLLVLKSDALYAVSDYWLEGGRLTYVLPGGSVQSLDPSEVDWSTTIQLNTQRGAIVRLRNAPRAQVKAFQ